MLIALGGVIAGYNGSFSFEKIGVEFPDTVPYIALRLVSCFKLLSSFYFRRPFYHIFLLFSISFAAYLILCSVVVMLSYLPTIFYSLLDLIACQAIEDGKVLLTVV